MIAKSKMSCLLLVSLLIALFVSGQQFGYQSVLDSVPQSGFYKIPLALNWTRVLTEDLSDLRIVDEKGKHVPYIIQQNPLVPGPYFRELPVLSNTTDSSHTILELNANGKHGIDHLSLVMSNHSSERYASLSGSDNRKQWFIIDEKILLKNAPDNSESHFVQQVRFPFIRYPYLKLKINNRSFDPLHILRAGVFMDTAIKEYSEFHLHPPVAYSQTDSADGNSYLWIHNSHLFPVDRISMVLERERYYKRHVEVYSTAGRKEGRLLASTEFISGKDPAIWLQGGKVAHLLVMIYNGDSPPLKVASLNIQSKKDYLIAYLEKEKKYQLVGGSTTARPPQYDLSYFKDSIPHHLPVVKPGEPVPFKKGLEHTRGNNQWWLWPAIIVMLLILAMLTFKMAREVKNEA